MKSAVTRKIQIKAERDIEPKFQYICFGKHYL